MKFKLTVAALLLACAPAVASQETPPAARYDETGRMIALHRLLTDEARLQCARFKLSGTVTRAEFDNKQQLVSFKLRTRKRGLLNISTLDASHLPANEAAKVSTLVKKGARLSVTAYGCGASAAVLEADSIEAM